MRTIIITVILTAIFIPVLDKAMSNYIYDRTHAVP